MGEIIALAIAFLAPALLIGMAGYYNWATLRLWQKHRNLEENGRSVDGTLKKKDEVRTHRSHSFYFFVEYEGEQADGKKGTFLQKGEVEENQYQSARIGDSFPVLYMPGKPEYSRVGGTYSLQKRILLTAVLDVVLVVGFILYMIFA